MRKFMAILMLGFLFSVSATNADPCNSTPVEFKSGEKTIAGLDSVSVINDEIHLKAGDVAYRIYPKYIKGSEEVKIDLTSEETVRETSIPQAERIGEKMETCIESTGMCPPLDKPATICIPSSGFGAVNVKEVLDKSNACGNFKDIFSSLKSYNPSISLRDSHGKVYAKAESFFSPFSRSNMGNPKTNDLVDIYVDCRGNATPRPAKCKKYDSSPEFRKQALEIWGSSNSIMHTDLKLISASDPKAVLTILGETSLTKYVAKSKFPDNMEPYNSAEDPKNWAPKESGDAYGKSAQYSWFFSLNSNNPVNSIVFNKDNYKAHHGKNAPPVSYDLKENHSQLLVDYCKTSGGQSIPFPRVESKKDSPGSLLGK